MQIQSTAVIHSRNRKIAITGAFSALIILMGIPGLHLGYIQINPTISLTIMHIPVVLAAALAGLPGAIVTSLVFGLTSLINAAANPGGVLDPLFKYPQCSVLPRLIFGFAAYGFFAILGLIPRVPKAINAAVSAFLSSLLHTVAVIGSLYVFLNTQTLAAMGGKGFLVIMGLVLPGAMMEAAAALLVSAAVVSAIAIGTKGKSKLTKEMSESEKKNSDSN
ncbi:MAG: ECF transporter S component [Treponema sp.]